MSFQFKKRALKESFFKKISRYLTKNYSSGSILERANYNKIEKMNSHLRKNYSSDSILERANYKKMK